MAYRDEGNAKRSEFIPVLKAVEAITGRRVNPSTVWRWIKKGLPGLNDERICLEVWPIGRTVLTTEAAVQEFIVKQKQAKDAKAKRGLDIDATVEELERHGLLPKKFPSQDSGKKSRDAWRRE